MEPVIALGVLVLHGRFERVVAAAVEKVLDFSAGRWLESCSQLRVGLEIEARSELEA